MKTFDEVLSLEMKRHISRLDSLGCDIGEQVLSTAWFREGARWAETNPELINEILTEYHEWAYNLPPAQFANWDDEEGDKEKTKARIRKEFIEYLNQKGWN